MKNNNAWLNKDLKDNFAIRWVKYWKTPSRPTKPELNYLKKTINKIKRTNPNPRVLILGSTIEYRDLMIDIGIRATVVDFSQDNYQILSQKMKYQDYSKREDFTQQAWLRMKFKEKFDLILGHMILNITPFYQWQKTLENVEKLLKNSGIFFINCWIRKNDRISNINTIVKEYNKKWKTKYSLWVSMSPKIVTCGYNVDKECKNWSELRPIIDTAFKDGVISKKDYQDYKNLGYNIFNFKLVIPTREKVEKIFTQYFDVKKIFFPKPYPNYHLIPNWVLVKKERVSDH